MHKYIADELILASCAPFLCPTLERWGVKKAKEQEKAYAIAWWIGNSPRVLLNKRTTQSLAYFTKSVLVLFGIDKIFTKWNKFWYLTISVEWWLFPVLLPQCWQDSLGKKKKELVWNVACIAESSEGAMCEILRQVSTVQSVLCQSSTW